MEGKDDEEKESDRGWRSRRERERESLNVCMRHDE